jgi:hypothetical protein
MQPQVLKDLSIKISQYFLDFLESDFKRQQAPKRRIILQTDNGFKSGMRVAPYAKLQSVLWDVLNRPINTELKLNFKPKTYYRQLNTSLKSIINAQVSIISLSSIEAIKEELLRQTKETLDNSLISPEEWIESLEMVLLSEISTQLVRPVLALIDEALNKQAYSAVDSIFNAEIDLVQQIAKPLEEVLTEVLARYTATKDEQELIDILNERLDIEFIKKSLIEYFEMFASTDAFLEFRDIETYSSTVESVQLYLYVGSIKYGSSTYPMFYVPVEVEYDNQIKGFSLELSSHVYANKRAFDYILQELSEKQARPYTSPIKERITYVGAEQSICDVLIPLVTKVQEAFGLLDTFEMSDGPVRQLEDTNISINNALHICAFEKSDEALLNDYEEMLSQARNNHEGVVKLFETIVGGVLEENPSSIESAIESQWNELSVSHRVVPESPIPLNEEQVKIINAISHKDGKFIVVEGPPGTGKSHTIVAIAAACAFKNKSCLILSDKKEALEVVQKKLSSVMNEVRGDSDFPNPLLRLGTEQANFRKLTSQQTLTQVQAHAKATSASQSRITDERDAKRGTLTSNIDKVIDNLGKLKTNDIANVQKMAIFLDELADLNLSKILDELKDSNPSFNLINNLDELDLLTQQLQEIYHSNRCNDFLALHSEIKTRAFSSNYVTSFNKEVGAFCTAIKEDDVSVLSNIISEYHGLKMPIFGYLFRGSKVAALNNRIQNLGTFTKQISLKEDVTSLTKLLTQLRMLISWIEEYGETGISFNRSYVYLSKKTPQSIAFKEINKLVTVIGLLQDNVVKDKYVRPRDEADFSNIWITSYNYCKAIQNIKLHFNNAPIFDYVGNKTEVEKLNISLMNSEVDGRLINFMQNFKADARTLATLIKNRQKFPEDKFDSVKEAFPVIVASIREFGEFMPLKQDIFDVLVIDEASQVSVAQAFPALLRAKKVVVMGDSKQFSNTKSSNASILLNNKYRADLTNYFKREVSSDAAMLERLGSFDVKKSILDFSKMCSNYSIMLRKHFRSYQELISYSSKNFYGGQLQAIKIRGVPISDVIEFSYIADHEGVTRNTNPPEADFILNKCIELLNEEVPPSVGIITPFKEQQTFLSKLFSNNANYQEFKSKLHLKIMTFDSCQGEERKIIFYSMVATPEFDALNYIFPVTLDENTTDELIEHKLKIQRLNVGFSRAQEMIWFVLSKPIDDFKGSIGHAIRHYHQILHTNRDTHEDTDPLSPMEKKVLDWIYASDFYQLYEEELEVLPQFPIGNYLKQLDPTYKHPMYKVDFLLTFTHDKGIVHIVIEYDGFEYHFKKDSEIDAGNHEQYLNDKDIERQLTLESYGYKFIRINRFNLGKDPIKSLSDRLYRLVDAHFKDTTNAVVRNLQNQASSLINKTAKSCPICKQIKNHDEYYDPKLKEGKGGYGRNCMQCKQQSQNAPKNVNTHRRWR